MSDFNLIDWLICQPWLDYSDLGPEYRKRQKWDNLSGFVTVWLYRLTMPIWFTPLAFWWACSKIREMQRR